jgi:hypothetical protein
MPKFRSLSPFFFLTVAALLISAVVPAAHGQRFGFRLVWGAGPERQCDSKQPGEGNHTRV